LDTFAKYADWTYKEVKSINGNKLISYQTEWVAIGPDLRLSERLGTSLTLMFKSLISQIIEYIFVFEGDTVRLYIESRYFATKNKLTYILYFFLYFLYAPAAFSIHSSKNSDNIQYVLEVFQMYFKDRVTVLKGR